MRKILLLLSGILWLTACTSGVISTPDLVSATPKVTEPPVETIVGETTPSPSPTVISRKVWAHPAIPSSLREQISLPQGWEWGTEELSVVHLVPQATQSISRWIYVLVAPFPTFEDDFSSSQLRNVWQKGKSSEDDPDHILVTPSTAAALSTLWGTPSDTIMIVPEDAILSGAWEVPRTWAIVPFEQLVPQWKVISLDGHSPIQKQFKENDYPLQVTFGWSGEPNALKAFLQDWERDHSGDFLLTNRDENRLTTVMLTGVTALVRGTAALMERNGMEYPAQDIGDWLREADILHVNNEVPFARNCPAPYNWQGLVFCSQERYIGLLEAIGTDVVELSGDHFADWGSDAMLFTLDLYRQRGWQTYGGGANDEEAKRPALFEHNGNRIAFIGCNYKEKGYASASPTTPGAIHCDPEWLIPLIRQVKAEGYLPIVTFQHQEYYEYIARPKLQEDFRAVADAGAVIVSGSQAHQPHAMEFYSGAFLHYGLGNLFFDQVYSMDSTRTAMMDRHVFYNGKHISTEVLTITFVDYARSRPSTLQERRDLLRKVFNASGWGKMKDIP